MKLAENWWDEGLNPITGYKVQTKAYSLKKIPEELKYYNAYPTLEIKK